MVGSGLLRVVALLCLVSTALAAPSDNSETRTPNRLINEASPYLRQHAYNPIDWYPWGPEAFEKAKRENKPIFLSVGYSTCHWCHVMERESFNDESIAEVLNLNYVAIKVDRERRPDVDETYMLATQLITRSGGWPNNVFLTPDLEPFYGGTYFPPGPFKEFLVQVAHLWETDTAALIADARRLAQTIRTIMTRRVEAAEIGPAALDKAQASILEGLDAFNGGFTDAPKFPQEAVLLFLLRRAEKDGSNEALKAVTLTLDNILNGGIHDHAGGGFHRYAVDPQWRIPHFEKMLYNQALLSQALVRAYSLTGRQRYAAALRRTLDYVLADLTAANGLFFSARDADSGGHEGTFYVWTPEQLVAALGEADAQFAQKVFGVTATGNFERETTILHFDRSPAEMAADMNLSETAFNDKVDAVRARLARAREDREAPFRDEKSITAWNGMMIAAFAEAAEVLDAPRYAEAARKAATSLWQNLYGPDGLKRTWFEGKAALEGHQDDYAFAALGLLAVYDLTREQAWLDRAEALAAQMVEKFRDSESGDYYMTASHSPFGKTKSRSDAGVPAGNAAALELFAKLAQRSRNPDHRVNGEALLAALSGLAVGSPDANAYTLMAADLLLRGGAGTRQYMVRGTVDAKASIDSERRRLTVQLRVAPGWHVNSSEPLEEFFIPTSLTIRDMPEAKTIYPKAMNRKLGFHDKPLALYEGDVTIRAELPTGADDAVSAVLTLQACSDEICLEPETAVLTVRN